MASTAIKSMRWFQFSLRSLFALTALMAVGLTALKFSTHGWAIAMTTITAALLLFAILQAIHGRDCARPFWSGFAIFGWGYMALLLFWGSSDNSLFGSNLATGEFLEFLFFKFNPDAEQFGEGLSSVPVFDVPDPVESEKPAAIPRAMPLPNLPIGDSKNTPPNPLLGADPFGDATPLPVTRPLLPAPDPFATAETKAAQEAAAALQKRRVYFPRIGHCLFTLLIGWIGGLLAQGIASARKETSPQPPTT